MNAEDQDVLHRQKLYRALYRLLSEDTELLVGDTVTEQNEEDIRNVAVALSSLLETV